MSLKLKPLLIKINKNKDLKAFTTILNQNYFSINRKLYANNTVDFNNGLVMITIPLAAKQEKCLFSLKPLNDNVGNFIDYIKNEDKTIEKVNLLTADDLRISNNTPVGALLQKPFKIKINESIHLFEPSKNLDNKILDYGNDVEGIKALVSRLYVSLNIEEHEKKEEDKLLKHIESLKNELEPLEKKKELLALKAKKHTNRMIWLGLGMMSLQAGILARLTWFEYSWDIVEPISYFVTYSAVIGVYAYFVLTRREYDYESATDRIFLRHFHKNAVKSNLDVQKYNDLKENLYNLELALKRIKENNNKIENLKEIKNKC